MMGDFYEFIRISIRRSKNNTANGLFILEINVVD